MILCALAPFQRARHAIVNAMNTLPIRSSTISITTLFSYEVFHCSSAGFATRLNRPFKIASYQGCVSEANIDAEVLSDTLNPHCTGLDISPPETFPETWPRRHSFCVVDHFSQILLRTLYNVHGDQRSRCMTNNIKSSDTIEDVVSDAYLYIHKLPPPP